ncbi:MAG: hypothetical protein XXXJIFNMEKO3_00878 [Candidatus Erwinia impunctatus]|nr:hypothetical protein XXXJIFNMEKO_00878 [Culicoides impunctatus]
MKIIYVVVLTHKKSLDEVENYLSAHIDWLEKGYASGLFTASGRRIPRTGGVILARSKALVTLEDYLRQDPFQQEQVVQTQ